MIFLFLILCKIFEQKKFKRHKPRLSTGQIEYTVVTADLVQICQHSCLTVEGEIRVTLEKLLQTNVGPCLASGKTQGSQWCMIFTATVERWCFPDENLRRRFFNFFLKKSSENTFYAIKKLETMIHVMKLFKNFFMLISPFFNRKWESFNPGQ